MTSTLNHLLAGAAAIGFFLMAQGVAAETIAPIALPDGYEGTEPAVTARNWVLVPSLTPEGQAILNADGSPAMEMVETETNEVVPGNTVVYEFTVANPSAAPLDDIQLRSAFPANLALEAGSFSGPEGMIVAFSTSEAPDTWHQIQPLPPEAERDGMPSIDAIANLRVTVPQVPVQTQALVSYAAVVRQGTITDTTPTDTTNPTLESE